MVHHLGCCRSIVGDILLMEGVVMSGWSGVLEIS